MKTLRFGVLGAWLLAAAFGQEGAAVHPWEEAALNAVKAINSGDADLYLRWTYPEELHRLKAAFLEKVLTPTPGVTPEELLQPLGIKSVDELARMPDATFAAVSIAARFAANPLSVKEGMAKATFALTKSEKIEEDHYRVHIAMHVPFEVQPVDREFVANVVNDGDGWKYNGFQ